MLHCVSCTCILREEPDYSTSVGQAAQAHNKIIKRGAGSRGWVGGRGTADENLSKDMRKRRSKQELLFDGYRNCGDDCI